MDTIIRAAEPTDDEGIREKMAQPIAQAITLQLPLAAVLTHPWKK
ncbi:MAG: hypothetical protein ACK5UX_05870 [Burkholderiales bacterium]|jgi:hypothetical protein